MTVLIDSNVWIEYFAGSERGKKAIPFIEGNEKIVISTINLAEVYRHILSKKNKQEAEKAKEGMLQYSFCIPVSTEIAIAAAITKHEKKIGLADSIILAIAQQENALLVTDDNDFRGQKNIQFVNF